MPVPIKRLIELIHQHRGNIAAVARACNRSWTPIAVRIKKSPEASKALHDARESTGDAIENALIESALEGNTTAQIFYLKCRRNWREHQHIHIEDVNVTELSDEELEALASAESIG